MSFQAYLDTIEKKTGRTPKELVDEAHARGFGADSKAGDVVAWPPRLDGIARRHLPPA